MESVAWGGQKEMGHRISPKTDSLILAILAKYFSQMSRNGTHQGTRQLAAAAVPSTSAALVKGKRRHLHMKAVRIATARNSVMNAAVDGARWPRSSSSGRHKCRLR